MQIIIERITNGWVLETEDEVKAYHSSWAGILKAVVKYLDENDPGTGPSRFHDNLKQTDLFEPNQD